MQVLQVEVTLKEVSNDMRVNAILRSELSFKFIGLLAWCNNGNHTLYTWLQGGVLICRKALNPGWGSGEHNTYMKNTMIT